MAHPERRCIACRRSGEKREFLRMHCLPEGTIRVDRSGRGGGRGAYVCPSEACIARALAPKMLMRAFRLTAPPQGLDALKTQLLQTIQDMPSNRTTTEGVPAR